MDKMNEVAKMLGVELGEEFNIAGVEPTHSPFTLTEDGMLNAHGVSEHKLFVSLITGCREIKKLPFKPKNDDDYWACDASGYPVQYTWEGDLVDLRNYKLGNVYRTKQDTENNIYKANQELEDYYKNN